MIRCPGDQDSFPVKAKGGNMASERTDDPNKSEDCPVAKKKNRRPTRSDDQNM